MIKVILRKLGYTHESDMTEDFYSLGLTAAIGDPMDYDIEKEEEIAMFKDLARVEHLPAYLTAMMAKDMQRSFSSLDEERPVIRGAFARAAYFKSRIRNANEEVRETKSAKTVLEGLRHG